MKNFIKNWLGITEIKHDINSIRSEMSIKKAKSYEESEQEKQLAYSIAIINALLDYLNVDFRKKKVIDNRFMMPEIPMTDVIEIIKKSK